jgi:hypothetical protein
MSNFTTAEQVADEMERRLATIKVADGFQTNVGARVLQGKLAIDDEMVPCTSMIEGIDDVKNSEGRAPIALITQQYAVVMYDACDPDRPNVRARQMIADAKRAIFTTGGKPDRTWGGKVRSINYRGRSIGPRADGAPLVMAVVEVEITYAEDLAQA